MASQPTFDLDGAGPARFVGDGLVRAARLRLLVRRHGRLRPLRQEARHLSATSPTAPTTSPRRPTTSRATRGVRSVHGLRHLVGRAARRAVRAAPSRSASRASRSTRSSGPAKARRRSTQRRKKLPEFLATKRRPIDRAFVHSIFERDHPDCARAARRRRVRRRDPRARRLDAQRHLHRHVLEAAGRRSGADHDADARAARPVRRHRRRSTT